MGQTWSAFRQMFPPKPTYTEANYPDMTGKVCVVTGANTGLGKQVARLLYLKNAEVWVACRNEGKAQDAIKYIQESHPNSKGGLHILKLDLSDLSTIKGSVETFLASSQRLDLLINNAGVLMPPQGSKTAQGYELQLGTNCLGHFLFTKLLTPTLATTATKAPQGSVRVVWVSSSAADLGSPKGGIDMSNLDYHKDKSPMDKYGVSKAGNYLHNTEYAKRVQKDGIVSVALNPGNLETDLARDQNWLFRLSVKAITYPVVNGAYTELFAGLSPEITLARSGCWVVPWGRFDNVRPHLALSTKSKEEGGTGVAQQFWEWSEEQVKPFL